MSNLLKILRTIFIRGPSTALLALVQLLFLLLFGILALLVRIIECLCKCFKKKNLKEEEEDEGKCNPTLPEDITRRPDPCIYSQQYLQSQGIAVTWNNPDIFMAKASTPAVIEPDSYNLEADTDYLVSVRCHNASTDLALGVRVRLLYRPWSFNSPDLLPVQITSTGQEVVRFANIAGMSFTVVQFTWHTPPVAPGQTQHFCLQAHLSHPMDTNLENNMGQENTNVHSANPGHVAPGEVVEVDVPLVNNSKFAKRFGFRADSYAIDTTTEIRLELKFNTGREEWPLSKQIGSLVPRLRFADEPPPRSTPPPPDTPVFSAAAAADTHPGPRFTFGRPRRRTITRARYVGHEIYKRQLLGQVFELPPGMTFETPGVGPTVELAPAEERNIPVRIVVPNDAPEGIEYSINVRAEDDNGRLAGGVTFLLREQRP
jgi:hypothetical protein